MVEYSDLNPNIGCHGFLSAMTDGWASCGRLVPGVQR